jgi:hypothetical protein
MKKHLQKGFAHLGLLLLVLVIVIVALVGYKVANNNSNSTTTTTTSIPKVQTINSKADLDKATATLNSANVDSDLNPSALDQDVQSLL